MSAIAAESPPLVPSADLLGAVLGDLAKRLGREVSRRPAAVHLIANPYSRVFRIDVETRLDVLSVFLKMPRVRPDNRDRVSACLRREFDALTFLERRFAPSTRFGVVTPLGLYAAHHALATLQAPGVPLRLELASGSSWLVAGERRERLRGFVRDCGRWLRQFHALTVRDVAPFEGAEFAEYCAVRLDMLGQHASSSRARGAVEAITRRITSDVDRLRGVECSVAGRHNDFAAHNIFVSDSGTTVLDFFMFDYGPVYYDVCNFWMDLEFMKFDPRYSRSFLSTLQRDFIAAYGGVDDQEPLFELVKCRYLVVRLLNATARAGSRSIAGVAARFEANACERALLRG